MRRTLAIIFAILIASPAHAQWARQLLVVFGRGTIPTRLPKQKNRVPPLVNPGIARVVLIVLENGDPDVAAEEPFLRDRAADGMLMREYYAVAHPSQPNYIAMISGSIAGTNGDFSPILHRPHLGDLLPGRWKAYAEDYPGGETCSFVRSDGAYVRRHVPFLNFAGVDCHAIVRLNSDRTTRTVSRNEPPLRDVVSVTSALRNDIENGTLPSFAMIIPNLEDDGHAPSNTHNANAWLTRYFAPLLDDPRFTKDTAFVLTFDEDEHTSASHPNRVFTVIWGDHVVQGVNDDVYDHDDLFLTIAALLGVTPLPETDESDSRPIVGIWR
jgi:acid phosphatase